MGQQSLIYSFVARGTVILSEYTEFTGNFTSIAAQCLQKLPASNNKFTYNCDGHTFNYLVEGGFNLVFFVDELMIYDCEMLADLIFLRVIVSCYAVNAVKYRISVKDRYLRYRLSR
ncbi:putative Longin domain-containing protein [Helianthus annuus]|nr:putative Longin domain-containing protein [Helianthus annuus]